jgi:NAD(P)-dependent dehydrogenase (short-subunit alcohol dehydrogenase family)
MKRALVTGGSGGIGAAICRRLAADGHHVIVHANRSLDKAAAVISAIIANGGSAEAVAFDVTDRTATEARSNPCSKKAPSRFWSTTPASTPTRFSPACRPNNGIP